MKSANGTDKEKREQSQAEKKTTEKQKHSTICFTNGRIPPSTEDVEASVC